MSKMPKVSVCVVTYNQEKYIGQCLKSIVTQKCDFDFEVIVGEDCSTDGTRAIVQEYANKYPDIVKPIFHEKNIGGGSHNFYVVHKAARGKYIAHVDGDDYCLPGKLQVQADFLDKNKDCNIVFHRMLHLMPSGEMEEGYYYRVKDIENFQFNRADLFRYIVIGGHSSEMYRKKFRDYDYPNFPLLDFFTYVEQIGDGFAQFVGYEYYGVYRVGIGACANGSWTRKAHVNSLLFFYKKYFEYQLEINAALLTLFLLDMRYLRKTALVCFVAWIRTFHIGCFGMVLRNIYFMMKVRTRK